MAEAAALTVMASGPRAAFDRMAASPIVKAKSVQLARRDFTPTFSVAQMLRDLGLILGAGEASGVSLPQTALTQKLLRSALAQGDGAQDYAAQDYAAIIKTLERGAGLAPLPEPEQPA
jgi:3-hydroxyisobutyrate dehydrogenase-like beta-hydroxyacid dehydrogenase